jgi:hypothetical protein
MKGRVVVAARTVCDETSPFKARDQIAEINAGATAP